MKKGGKVEDSSSRRVERPPQESYVIESMDHQKFTVSAAALRQAKTLLALIDNLNPEIFRNEPIWCETINAPTLKLVLQWMEQHKEDEPSKMLKTRQYRNLVIPKWDDEFLKKLDNGQHFDLLCAANYLEVQKLMDYGCKAVANMAKGKTTEEMRILFGIRSDEEAAEAALMEPGPSTR